MVAFAMVKGDCAGTEFLSLPQGTLSNPIMDQLAVSDSLSFLFTLLYSLSFSEGSYANHNAAKI